MRLQRYAFSLKYAKPINNFCNFFLLPFKVFDGFKDLKHRRASVNRDTKLEGCTICRVALDSKLDDEIDMDSEPEERKYFMEEENEIDRLLDKFINGDMDFAPNE